jgi:hypothetical protein
VALAGAVPSDGAAGAHRAGQAFVRQVGREGPEPIGLESVRRSVMCLEVDLEAIGREVMGAAAAVPEPVVRVSAAVLLAAPVVAAAAVVVAAAPAAAAAVAAVATAAAAGDPALTSVF